MAVWAVLRLPKLVLKLAVLDGRAVMVARFDPVRHAAVVRMSQAVVALVHWVPFEALSTLSPRPDDIRNVAGGLVVHHPLHLRVVDGRIRGGVILRVGDGDQGEVSADAVLWTAIE